MVSKEVRPLYGGNYGGIPPPLPDGTQVIGDYSSCLPAKELVKDSKKRKKFSACEGKMRREQNLEIESVSLATRRILPELAEFTPFRREQMLEGLQGEILIGLHRISRGEGPTEEDGGLLAIPFPVGRPTRKQLKRCPPQRILVCVFAGENWQVEKLGWDGSGWQERIKKKRRIRRKEREFRGKGAFSRFVGLMADCVEEVMKEVDNPQELEAIAVSFGFVQENELTDYGLEARLSVDNPAKHWLIEGAAGKNIGKALLEELRKRGRSQLKRTYFANDTICVALDTMAGENTLPMGVVIGNGANVAMESRGRLVNLEIGQTKALGGERILGKMNEFGLTPEGQRLPLLEYYFSGAYQLPRLVAALHLLAESKVVSKQVASQFLQALEEKGNDPRILDWLITGEVDEQKLSEHLGIKVDEADFAYVKATAQLVMRKAIETAALMITSVLKVADWQRGEIPITGSVFWKAKVGANEEIFGDEVRELVNQWTGGNFKFVMADEMRGIAGLALEE